MAAGPIARTTTKVAKATKRGRPKGSKKVVSLFQKLLRKKLKMLVLHL